MGDAEVMKLVMMHMSKGYHDEEIGMFKDFSLPEAALHEEGGSAVPSLKKETSKKKRIANRQVTQLE